MGRAGEGGRMPCQCLLCRWVGCRRGGREDAASTPKILLSEKSGCGRRGREDAVTTKQSDVKKINDVEKWW